MLKISKIKRLLEKREEDKQTRLIWVLVAVAMAGVLCLYLAQVKHNLQKMKNASLPNLSGISEKMDELNWNNETVENWKEHALTTYENDEENINYWKNAGDQYLSAEENERDKDEFLSLEFAGIEADEENIQIRLKYNQLYKDIPVLDENLVVIFDPAAGEFTGTENNLVQNLDIAIDPEISLREAKRLAADAIPEDRYEFSDGNLAIAKYKDTFYLVWDMFFENTDSAAQTAENTARYEILIGAKNRTVVSVQKTEAEE